MAADEFSERKLRWLMQDMYRRHKSYDGGKWFGSGEPYDGDENDIKLDSYMRCATNINAVQIALLYQLDPTTC